MEVQQESGERVSKNWTGINKAVDTGLDCSSLRPWGCCLSSWILEPSVLPYCKLSSRFGPPSREGRPLCQHSEDGEDGEDGEMTPPLRPGRLVIVSTQWTADTLHEITATP